VASGAERTARASPLDVTFRGDPSRFRRGHAPIIRTALLYPCVNLLDPPPSWLSAPKKRRTAAWNDDQQAQVCVWLNVLARLPSGPCRDIASPGLT